MTPPPDGEHHRPLTGADGRRLLGLGALLFLAWWLVNTLGTTLLLFAASTLLAMVLNPLVVRLERRGLRRGLAVLTLVAATLALLGLAGWLLAPALLDIHAAAGRLAAGETDVAK